MRVIPEITTFEIEKRLGIKRDRLKEWLFVFLPDPSIQVGKGKGTKNIFDLLDVYVIKLFEQMIDFGFDRFDASEGLDLFSSLIRRRGFEMSECNWVAFPYKKGGMYISENEVGYIPALVAPDLPTLGKDLAEEDPLWVEEILIVNFMKVREEVDLSFES